MENNENSTCVRIPRRRELLTQMGITDFIVLLPEVDETIPDSTAPDEAVLRLSEIKTASVSKTMDKESIIIAADTVVAINGEILGKPADENDAFRMLSMLSGNMHEVFTGICVICGEKKLQALERTEVYFLELAPDEIRNYIKTGEPFDKAGAYGIQGAGGMFVKSINGDFYNVIGLPICTLSLMLKEFGIQLL